MDSPTTGVTLLLQQARDPNNRAAREQLYELVQGELRKVAQARLRQQGPGDHTLQATALIDEAFVRLVMGTAGPCEDRQQFYRLASGVMRRILIDHSRRQRPGSFEGEQLANVPGGEGPAPDARLLHAERLLALDRALERLYDADPEAAELFEMHYFGGLRVSLGATPEEWIIHIPEKRPPLEQVAAALGMGRATAYRILDRAKKFLRDELQDEAR